MQDQEMESKQPQPARDYISLAEAAQKAPGHPHVTSLWRWCRKGVKTRNGACVRLQHIRAGARIFTTAEWLDAFFVALVDADLAYFDETPDPPPTLARRAVEIERTKERLARAGLL